MLKTAMRWTTVAVATLLLTGCDGGFFINTTTTTTTSSGSDYIFVANQTTSTLSAYSVSTSGLSLVSGSPYSLPSNFAPTSVAVSRADTFVYVGGLTEIVGFSIGTTGALTSVAAATVIAQNSNFVSLDTSPDGKWLFALDASLTAPAVSVYSINSSTGALSLASTINYRTYGNILPVSRSIHISPSGNLVVACLGSGGDVSFTFSDTNGVLTQTNMYPAAANYVGDNDVAFDSNSAYVYFARANSSTGQSVIASYTIDANANLSPVLTNQIPVTIPTGDTPYNIIFESAGTNLYVANRGANSNSVTGYSVASGTLTPLHGSPFASGQGVTALAEDNGKNFIIAAAAGGSSDISVYKFDAISTGQLDAIQVLASGNDPAGSTAVAATH